MLKLAFEPDKIFKFGVGKLTVEYGYPIALRDTYDGGFACAFRMIYSAGEHTHQIASLEELVSFAQSNAISIESEVSADVDGWVNFVFRTHRILSAPAEWLDPAVIYHKPSIRKEFSATKGINIQDWLPTVRANHLVFYAVAPNGGAGSRSILKYECDLLTFKVVSEVVQKVRIE